MTVGISTACTACGACLATCPTDALIAARHRPLVIDASCTDCLACVEVCPADAINLIEPILHKVLRSRRGGGSSRAAARQTGFGPVPTKRP